MTAGSYDELTGNLELAPVEGKPEVFVIGGAGSGTRGLPASAEIGDSFCHGRTLEK